MDNFSILDRLIVNMKILSQIQVGDKLQVDYYQNFYIDKYYFQSIYRMALRQSRSTSCSALLKLVSDLQSISPGCMDSDNGITLDLLVGCKQGIINLKDTYIDDHECCGCLCRITEQLQGIIDSVSEHGTSIGQRVRLPSIINQPADRAGAAYPHRKKKIKLPSPSA